MITYIHRNRRQQMPIHAEIDMEIRSLRFNALAAGASEDDAWLYAIGTHEARRSEISPCPLCGRRHWTLTLSPGVCRQPKPSTSTDFAHKPRNLPDGEMYARSHERPEKRTVAKPGKNYRRTDGAGRQRRAA